MQWGIGSAVLSAGHVTPQLYWKNLRPATRKNFSRKISESRTAMWAARPIRELAVLGRAWMTSYRTRLQSLFWRTGSSRFSIISAYTGPCTGENTAKLGSRRNGLLKSHGAFHFTLQWKLKGENVDAEIYRLYNIQIFFFNKIKKKSLIIL